jgi:hypothetical protein
MASAGSPNSASAMPYASAASAFAGARSTARFRVWGAGSRVEGSRVRV